MIRASDTGTLIFDGGPQLWMRQIGAVEKLYAVSGYD